MGDWFDQLRKELQNIAHDLASYVEMHEGRPQFLAKLSPPDTHPGHRLMGQVSALQSELEFQAFGQLKFFTAGTCRERSGHSSIWRGNGEYPRAWRLLWTTSLDSSCRGNSSIRSGPRCPNIPGRLPSPRRRESLVDHRGLDHEKTEWWWIACQEVHDLHSYLHSFTSVKYNIN